MNKLKAYVMVNTELSQEESILAALNKIDEVSRVHLVYGIYDLIVEVEAESVDKVKEIIFNKIRIIEYVKNTVTLLTFGESVIDE